MLLAECQVWAFFRDGFVAHAPRIAWAIVLLLAFWAGGVVVRMSCYRIANRLGRPREQVFRLIGSAGKILSILVGLIVALGVLGVDVAAMIAALGLGGFALGFALKDVLSNLLAGALLLVNQPFRLGDHITVAGCDGEVMEINLRYTVLKGADKQFLIPNSTLFTTVIHLDDQPGSAQQQPRDNDS
jgi:small-conductance mechanosensitive channel